MYLMIDHFDSFVYNLSCYFQELGAQIELIRSNEVSASKIAGLLDAGVLEGLILSPGPKSPSDCALSMAVTRRFAGQIPILGICLGHQIIGQAFGGTVSKGRSPMHGKLTEIQTNRQRLFSSLPSHFQVTRYHSLVVERDTLPDCFCMDAAAADGTLMAISHREFPLYGVQFHPEAVMTQYGHELLSNYLQICRLFKNQNSVSALNRSDNTRKDPS